MHADQFRGAADARRLPRQHLQRRDPEELLPGRHLEAGEHPVRPARVGSPEGAQLFGDLRGQGKGLRRLRHGRVRRRRLARQCGRPGGQDRPDLHRLRTAIGDAGGLRVGRLRHLPAGVDRPLLYGHPAERELQLRPDQPGRAALRRGPHHGPARLHRYRPDGEPQRGLAHRQRRQSQRRPLPRQPVRPVAGVVPEPRRAGRRRAVLQGHRILHHRQDRQADLRGGDGDAEPVALHQRRHARLAELFNCRSTSASGPTAAAATSRARVHVQAPIWNGFGVQTNTPTPTPRRRAAIRCPAIQRTPST